MEETFGNELFDGQESYAIPAPKDVVIDTKSGKILDDFKPIHMIIAAAQQHKLDIKIPVFKEDGSYDTGCRRKDCMGRGWIAMKEGMPIACSCIFHHKDLMNPERNRVKLNRKQARKYVSMQSSQDKEQKRIQAAEMGLKQADADVWVNSNKVKFSSRWNEEKKKWIFEKIK